MKILALAAALALALPAAVSAQVTLINVFEVPEGEIEESIAAWEAARDFLSEQPGYISTALHQSLEADARFQLVNIARWESESAFYEAIELMRSEQVFPQIEGLRTNAALYRVVRRDEDCRRPPFGPPWAWRSRCGEAN